VSYIIIIIINIISGRLLYAYVGFESLGENNAKKAMTRHTLDDFPPCWKFSTSCKRHDSSEKKEDVDRRKKYGQSLLLNVDFHSSSLALWSTDRSFVLITLMVERHCYFFFLYDQLILYSKERIQIQLYNRLTTNWQKKKERTQRTDEIKRLVKRT